MLNVSIVLYNNPPSILLKAIESCLKYSGMMNIYLIDNSPNDNLKDISLNQRVFYIHNPTNPGFGAAHNIAIQMSMDKSIDYHLVLNPDIYFENGVLEKIIEFMESNKDVGHLMPKILYPNSDFQYLCKSNPTIFDLFARGFLPERIKTILKNRLNKYEYRQYDFNKIIYDIPYLSGCFMFFRVDSLRKIGLFDDRIFMYLEDADITRRILNVARTVYFPETIIYHHYAGLTHKEWKYKWITIKSAFVYFNKWGWFKSII